MTTWKGRHAELVLIDETRAYSPLAPYWPELEPPIYGTPPTAPTRFIPFGVPDDATREEAIGYILYGLLHWCWHCGRRYDPLGFGLHVCWTDRLACELCSQLHPAVCDRGRRRVADHDCPVLQPFLEEARS